MRRKTPQATEHMIARGRQLRQDAPFPERLLWGKLRNRRCAGLKFRRQQPLGPYVADFFCASARVVIELDGRSHTGQEVQDKERQRYLEEMGFKVIRFTNDRVLANLAGVVEAIAMACTPSSGPAGHLLPCREKGKKRGSQFKKCGTDGQVAKNHTVTLFISTS